MVFGRKKGWLKSKVDLILEVVLGKAIFASLRFTVKRIIMAKKKSKKKKVTPKSKSKSKSVSGFGSGKKKGLGRPKKGSVVSGVSRVSRKKKYKKKAGRKPSVPNKYNAIKSAISSHYKSTIGRAVKHYEMKIIYQWIESTYVGQSVRYILMNIDVILDNFWREYCNLYPVDLYNHARFFDWYNFKTFLNDEKPYHYPSDIIQVDLSAIGQENMEFFMEDYLSASEEYYQTCKSAGIKQTSPPPSLYLKDAFCDISKKGNVFQYILLLDGDIPRSEPSDTPYPQSPANTPVMPPTGIPQTGSVPASPVSPVSSPAIPPAISPEQAEIEIAKERTKLEFQLKQAKIKELAQLLKDGVITFEQYIKAIKEV